MLKSAHLHCTFGHSQFAPKGAKSQFVGTYTLHLSCSHTGRSSQCPHRSMMILLIFFRMMSHNKGFVSCPGPLCKIGYLSAPKGPPHQVAYPLDYWKAGIEALTNRNRSQLNNVCMILQRP